MEFKNLIILITFRKLEEIKFRRLLTMWYYIFVGAHQGWNAINFYHGTLHYTYEP